MNLDHIDRFEEHINHLDAQLQLVVAQLVQQRFQDMRGFSDLVETEGGAATLDGMRRAEYRVQRVLAGVLHVEFEQQMLHLLQQLSGLLEKHLIELTHVDGHSCSSKA